MNVAKEDVFGKADALMRRRRAFVAAGAEPVAPATPPTEDVPTLTEVFDPNLVDPNVATPEFAASLSGGPGAQALAAHMHDLLAPLPPDIARAVEDWLAATLPKLVARQLDGVAEHIAAEVGAALHDSLPLLISDLVRSATERTKTER